MGMGETASNAVINGVAMKGDLGQRGITSILEGN